MGINIKVYKIYLAAIYGSVLWELCNNNNDFDYKDMRMVVTFNRKSELIFKCTRNFKDKFRYIAKAGRCLLFAG